LDNWKKASVLIEQRLNVCSSLSAPEKQINLRSGRLHHLKPGRNRRGGRLSEQIFRVDKWSHCDMGPLQDRDRSTYARTRRLFDAGCGCRKVELQPNLPRAHGDERKLTQVLLNLVGNAIKFTDEGEVAIKAAAANGSITVSVRDSGPGITEADQDTILPEISASRLAITSDKAALGWG
jgi:signal transduction histidine kinase